MRSRMDKYQTKTKEKYERLKKNTKLYEEVYDDMYRDTTYKNMEVIDSAKEINLTKLKDMLDDKYDTRQYRTLKNYSIEDLDIENKPTFEKKRQRIYDINEIINEAKNKRAFIEEAKEKQKYMDFTTRREKKYDKYDEMEKEEKELEELINTMALSDEKSETNEALDMFSDLKGSENTIITNPIKTSFEIDNSDTNVDTNTNTINTINNNIEKTLVKADRTFYTDSNMFTKNDFEDFSTLTRQLSRSKKGKTAFIILLILIIVGVLAYFVITRYIIK